MTRAKSLMSAGHSALASQAITGTVQTLALAGSSSTDATKITASNVLMSSGSGGAILPASDAGDRFFLKNESGSTCTLYPPTGATINTASSLSFATAKGIVVWFSSPTACHTIPTVPA